MTNQTPKSNIEQFKTALKAHSLKATPQRLAVHEAMLALGHASADMVTEEIRKNGNTKVTVASVYNILTNLAMLGIYHYRLSSNNMEMVENYLSRKRYRGYSIDHIDIQLVGRPTKKKRVSSL